MSKVIVWNLPQSKGRPPNFLSRDLDWWGPRLLSPSTSVIPPSAEVLHFTDYFIFQGIFSHSTGARFLLFCFVLLFHWFGS